MAKSIYILKNSVMKRYQNTISIVYKDNEQIIKKPIPINETSSIFAYGRVSLTSGVISLLSKMTIPVHFFNYYGFYESSLLPKKDLISGEITIRQAENYLNNDKRIHIARQIIESTTFNILKNLEYYNVEREYIERIKELNSDINSANSIKGLMGIEGNIHSIYYEALDSILPDKFRMIKREKRPPTNIMNSLISFGNSLVYATTINEIYNTHLNQTISFLHEPLNARYSLSLDISEMFKPVISDRIIMTLINKKMVDESYFDKNLNYVILNEKGRRLFIEKYEERMNSTIKYKPLNRKVSMRHLIRIECYKLEKHLLGIDNYKAFKVWW